MSRQASHSLSIYILLEQTILVVKNDFSKELFLLSKELLLAVDISFHDLVDSLVLFWTNWLITHAFLFSCVNSDVPCTPSMYFELWAPFD